MEDTADWGAQCDLDLRPTVLLLEDDFSLRYATARILREMGYRIIEGASADEGVSVLNAGTRIEAVFSDVNMPGQTDGVAFAQWLAVSHPTIPVRLTSGAPEASLALSGAANRGYLRKPYDYHEVDRRVRAMIRA